MTGNIHILTSNSVMELYIWLAGPAINIWLAFGPAINIWPYGPAINIWLALWTSNKNKLIHYMVK